MYSYNGSLVTDVNLKCKYFKWPPWYL